MEITLEKSNKKRLQILWERFDMTFFDNLLIPFVLILFGIMLGSITSNTLNGSEELDMKKYFSGFLNMVKLQNVNKGALFHRTWMNNTKIYLLFCFMSVSVIGIPFIYATVAVKGFLVGFTAGTVFKVLGGKGFAPVLCLILPKELIFLTATMFMAAIGVSLCRNLIYTILPVKQGFEVKRNFIPEQLLKTIPCYGLLVIGCFFEAFICPFLLKLVL